MTRLRSGTVHFCTRIVTRYIESMAMPSPKTAMAGDITSSGSMPFLNEKIVKKVVKGIITILARIPLMKPMSVNFVIPADGR